MDQLVAWSDAEDSVFDSEVASVLESLGDLEAEAEEKSRREDLRLASEVESSPYHKGLSLFGEFQGGEIDLEAPAEELELGAFEPSEVLAPHGEIELEVSVEEPEVSAEPDVLCKSCGNEVRGNRIDFCSYGCEKRAAFNGLPLKFPRTDKPRGRRGQP